MGGQCEVTVATRKLCTACRLTKCLAVGMSPELIRKEDLSVRKRKSSKSFSQESIEKQQQLVTVSKKLKDEVMGFPLVRG